MTIAKEGEARPRAVQPSDNAVRASGDRLCWSGGGLYRAEADGTQIVRLAEDASSTALTFDDHYVYYSNGEAVPRVAK